MSIIYTNTVYFIRYTCKVSCKSLQLFCTFMNIFSFSYTDIKVLCYVYLYSTYGWWIKSKANITERFRIIFCMSEFWLHLCRRRQNIWLMSFELLLPPVGIAIIISIAYIWRKTRGMLSQSPSIMVYTRAPYNCLSAPLIQHVKMRAAFALFC